MAIFHLSNIKVWHKDFRLMTLTTFLLSLSIYVQMPILPQWLLNFGENYWEIGCTYGIFGIGMFILGPLCSYFVQQFRRNIVCIWSIIGLIVSTGAILYADRITFTIQFFHIICILRLLQGAFWGLAQMILCSTLIIETTDSYHRTEANYISSWFERLALPCGASLGILIYNVSGVVGAVFVSIIFSLIAAICILVVRFPFKAPEENSHLLRLDRFFLYRGWPLFSSLVIITSICGLILSFELSSLFFIIFIIGMMIAFLLLHSIFSSRSVKLHVISGLLSIGISVTGALTFGHSAIKMYFPPLFMGIGIGLIGAQYLLNFVNITHHCQRGTSQSTFFLGWNSGIHIGIFSSFAVLNHDINNVLCISLILLLILLLSYITFIHKWYIANKNR